MDRTVRDAVDARLGKLDFRRMWKKILFPLTLVPSFCGAFHDINYHVDMDNDDDFITGNADVGGGGTKGNGEVPEAWGAPKPEPPILEAPQSTRTFLDHLLLVYHFLITVAIITNLGYVSSLYFGAPVQFRSFDGFVIVLSSLIQSGGNNAIMFWNCRSKNGYGRFVDVLGDYATVCKVKGVTLPWKRFRIVSTVLALLSLVGVAVVGVIFTVLSDDPVSFEDTPVSEIIIGLLRVILAQFDVVILFFSPSLFVLVCYILSRLFSELTAEFDRAQRGSKRIDGPMLESFRRRHAHICQLVEIADSAFSPILGLALLCNTVSVLFLGYTMLDLQTSGLSQGSQSLHLAVWLVLGSIIISIYSVAAVILHEKAHSLRSHVHDLKKESYDPQISEAQILFLARLDGPEIGMSALGCFVITKERVLAVISGLVTYFTILLQFKGTPSPTTSDVTWGAQSATTIDGYITETFL